MKELRDSQGVEVCCFGFRTGGLAGEVRLFLEVTRAGGRGREMCYHESSGPSKEASRTNDLLW